ncbi:heme-binding domain-containing protein [Flavobacterium sp. KACC 22761]|uniref:heme-binding domain-containing protein n=1 Tax=Flavobacterium sp. KACC 22761 TaxID=3092665 RepID=UPI002A752904|nr:heme-binding domain-containing protein [Flavobacterium sp. KACC 22761]WPO78181.1 heme-binding domain-containing protein [Flavobacterium sp. KACC 22761]
MKKVVILIAVILVAIQFYRPDKNISENSSHNSIEKQYTVPENVRLLLKTSCYDCHSNNTYYPWYSNIQPVAWWLNKHIVEGKRELNFDEFNSYSPEKKKKKLVETIDEIEKNGMPLRSYTFIHKDAVLTQEQQKEIIDWAKKLKDSIPD